MKHPSLSRLVLMLLNIWFCTLNTTNAQKSEKALADMILLNLKSVENPLYVIPCATADNDLYLTTAFTDGAAVVAPLQYVAASPPASAYVNFSKTATIARRGHTMNLTLKTSKSSTVDTGYVYLFADWNRDGHFDQQ